MANNSNIWFMLFLSLLVLAAPLCLCHQTNDDYDLSPYYYHQTCPNATAIVMSVVKDAVANESRMAASLLRLHFHDCFVQGCDASLLLDSTKNMTSEQESNPNNNSARGYDVIGKIKSEVEKACPGKVSCADILALAARDSTHLMGGPYWPVPLGRKDSANASLNLSNNNIPAPNNTFNTILDKFTQQGLTMTDLVALSGSHTIGKARCVSIRQRLYDQAGKPKVDPTLDKSYADELRKKCPSSGRDGKLFSLDFATPTKFDNRYFNNLLNNKGLLNSDQVLAQSSESQALVRKFANDNGYFSQQFATSMLKMGNINVLTGLNGIVRKKCGKVDAA